MKNYSFNEIAELMIALTSALEANTAAILGGSQRPATVDPEPKPAAVDPEPTAEVAPEAEISIEDVEAAALRVKSKHGVEEVRKIVKSLTGTTSIKKIEPSDFAAVIEALGAKEAEDVETEQTSKEDTVDYAELRNEMDKLVAELAGSEAGFGRAENFEKAKHLIKTVGGAPKKAEIPDKNLEAMISALKDALVEVAEAEAAKNDDDL